MVFSSIIFLFYFLPVFLACYYALPFKHATLLLFSLFFYAWGEVQYTYVMLGSIVVNYGLGLWIDGQEGRGRKVAVGAAVAVNLAALGWFKYAAFLHGVGADVLPQVFSGPAPQVHLPLGISFFTFHAISYLVDVYRREVPAERSIVYLAVYITMFPQLVAGPIIRFHDIRDEIHQRRVTPDLFTEGVQIFVLGLAQKVLIANVVAQPADQIFALDPGQLSTALAWFGALLYTLQIYFDFCGYSTMAIGLGLMMGFHFPLNFDHPYIARSITEFWRRWHISLSTWFRDYVYIPLGGNRHGPLTTYRNLVLVFFLCGLWHGAAWTFVVWGLYHGFFLVLERVGLARVLGRLAPPLRHLYAILVIMVGWVFFRADNLTHAGTFLSAMAGFGASGAPALRTYATGEVWTAVVIGCIAATPSFRFAAQMLRGRLLAFRGGQAAVIGAGEVVYVAGLVAILAFAAMRLAAGTYNPFIYFRF
ncbi:MAG TPA: MBOAT family protein [Beijerinckiaceae bacterium]|jgi:alginate O-acetyltransferase complex protein AlgI